MKQVEALQQQYNLIFLSVVQCQMGVYNPTKAGSFLLDGYTTVLSSDGFIHCTSCSA